MGWDGDGSAVWKEGFPRVLGHRLFHCGFVDFVETHWVLSVQGRMGWDGME